MFTSLRTRLTLLFVTLSIVPIVLVSALAVRTASDPLQQTSVDLLDQLTRQTSISLEAFFNERQNELLLLTDVYGFGSLEQTAQKDVLAALLNQQPAYYQLTLANSDGQEAMQLTRGALIVTTGLANRVDDPQFKQAVETGTVSLSPVYFSDAARDRLVTVTVPIVDLYTGQVSQVLIAELRFQNVEEAIIRNLNLSADEDVYVLDSDGIVIAHRNPNYVLKETVFDLPEAGGRHAGLDGDDDILAMHTLDLGTLKLTVVAERSYVKATALVDEMSRINTIVTIATLLVTTAIVIVVVSRVVRPILKISRVAQAVQKGDFSQRLDVGGKDEIGQLAAGFNEMTDAIQKREADLKEQADALRVATARAKEAARVKGEFLANVSHELRTPLNAIIGFSDMLLAGMSGPLNDKQAHKMERLKDNGARLLALINDLLDLTRIESGRLETVEKAFSPRVMAQRITAQMEGLAEESKLQFETVVSSDVPETLFGDEKRVEQILVNLLSNAFKFTKEGSVTLSIGVNEAEQTWNMEVADTGIGIPPHAVNIIFEEFRQLDGSYARAYKGSGLGLAITRNLVRIMGGKISVKSTQGVGSTFTVVLPLSFHESTKPAVTPAVATAVAS